MNNYKIILGIETSCDETAASVVKKEGDQLTVLSSVISSSAELQAKYGGIIPEQAAREQIKAIIPVIEEALIQAFPITNNNSDHLPSFKEGVGGGRQVQNIPPIDAIAVTYGPGLIGSLLVGVETAKTLAMAWNKPLLPINHLIGHYYANWINPEDGVRKTEDSNQIIQKTKQTDSVISHPSSAIRSQSSVIRPTEFPCIGLLVSGGHTDLVLFQSHNNYKYLGGTRDDAAGECFDKCARLLGFPYPGGPKISELSKEGDPKKFPLPLPMSDSHDYDFSFSGLKTAFRNQVNQLISESVNQKKTEKQPDQPIHRLTDQQTSDLCASLENTIVKSLVKKTLKAVKEYQVSTVIVGGGVSANQRLRENLKFEIQNLKLDIKLHFPDLKYCGDNAAMIASAAFFINPIENVISLQADPNLSL